MQGRIRMHFLEIISADIVFKFCRYTDVSINRGWGPRSHYLQGAPKETKTQPYPPQIARKLNKINILLDLTRKQSSFWLQKIGLYYLLGLKQAKSDYFSEIGYLFEVRHLPNLSL